MNAHADYTLPSNPSAKFKVVLTFFDAFVHRAPDVLSGTLSDREFIRIMRPASVEVPPASKKELLASIQATVWERTENFELICLDVVEDETRVLAHVRVAPGAMTVTGLPYKNEYICTFTLAQEDGEEWKIVQILEFVDSRFVRTTAEEEEEEK